MKFYINNLTNQFQTSELLTTSPAFSFFKGDTIQAEIRFIENGVVADPGTIDIRLGVGLNDSLIALTETWTKHNTGTATYFSGTINLNTQQAEIALDGKTSVVAVLEVETSSGGQVSTKAQTTATIKRDLINEADSQTDIGNIVSIGQAHIDATTNVHGIANTANLITTDNLGSAVSNAVNTQINNHNSFTQNVHGIANTANLVTNATIQFGNGDGNRDEEDDDGNIIRTFGAPGLGGHINIKGGNGGIIQEGGSKGGDSGSIDLSGGNAYAENDAGNGGNITLKGGNDSAHAGSIDLSGADYFGKGGSIISQGYQECSGGTLNMSAGNIDSGNKNGGSIITVAGGSINTAGYGSIELGSDGTRTILQGQANGNKTLYFPNESGELQTQSGSYVTANVAISRALAPSEIIVTNIKFKTMTGTTLLEFSRDASQAKTNRFTNFTPIQVVGQPTISPYNTLYWPLQQRADSLTYGMLAHVGVLYGEVTEFGSEGYATIPSESFNSAYRNGGGFFESISPNTLRFDSWSGYFIGRDWRNNHFYLSNVKACNPWVRGGDSDTDVFRNLICEFTFIPTESSDLTNGKLVLSNTDRTTTIQATSTQQRTINLPNASGTISLDDHTHTIANVTGLQTALDGKQASGNYASATHTHTKSQITDFSHTHAISDVTNLQTTLDAKRVYTYLPTYYTANYGFSPSPNTERHFYILASSAVNPAYVYFPSSGNSVGDIVTITFPSNPYITYLILTETTSGSSNTFGQIYAGTTQSFVRTTATTINGGWRSLSTYAHTHNISDITSLQATLDAKASLTSVTDLQTNADNFVRLISTEQTFISNSTAAGDLTLFTLKANKTFICTSQTLYFVSGNTAANTADANNPSIRLYETSSSAGTALMGSWNPSTLSLQTASAGSLYRNSGSGEKQTAISTGASGKTIIAKCTIPTPTTGQTQCRYSLFKAAVIVEGYYI